MTKFSHIPVSRITYGSKLSGGPVEADRHQKVVVKFVVKDTTSGENTRVHQAFVRVAHASTGREIIFVADPDGSDVYKFDMVRDIICMRTGLI